MPPVSQLGRICTGGGRGPGSWRGFRRGEAVPQPPAFLTGAARVRILEA